MYLKVMLLDILLKYLTLLVETEIKKVSQATVEVYIILSSRERYFIILLN